MQKVKFISSFLFVALLGVSQGCSPGQQSPPVVVREGKMEYKYPIVHTNVSESYNDVMVVQNLSPGDPFWGQDASFRNNLPSYTDNGDGTITDNITGLMWRKDMGEKMTLPEAEQKLRDLNEGKYNDWRIPAIKELFSLADYSGRVSGDKAVDLFIDTDFFNHPLGDVSKGEREIDAQTWSATEYLGTTMIGDRSRFGFNFVDGRIKAYPIYNPRTSEAQRMYFRFVRGNEAYGENRFIDNGDGTITDLATGLMWQQSDNGQGVDWQTALRYAENLELAGHSDWRLPSVKELQSIIDYSIAVQQERVPAIDPLFEVSERRDPEGAVQFPFFWSATTLLDGPQPGRHAAYVAFGKALGRINGMLVDAHGAGAIRSDPKSGDRSRYPSYFGPQGDIQYVYNYVRCVRNIEARP